MTVIAKLSVWKRTDNFRCRISLTLIPVKSVQSIVFRNRRSQCVNKTQIAAVS
jgi:hypothetical protein